MSLNVTIWKETRLWLKTMFDEPIFVAKYSVRMPNGIYRWLVTEPTMTKRMLFNVAAGECWTHMWHTITCESCLVALSNANAYSFRNHFESEQSLLSVPASQQWKRDSASWEDYVCYTWVTLFSSISRTLRQASCYWREKSKKIYGVSC